MSKNCVKACMVAFALTLLLSFARVHAQTISVSGSCPKGVFSSFVYVSWTTAKGELPIFQLTEYYNGPSGSGRENLGSSYSSGESSEIELNNDTFYDFVLYDDVTPSNPNGTEIASLSVNCVGTKFLQTAAPAPIGRMGDWSVFDPLTFLQPRAESNSGSGNLTREVERFIQ